MALDEAAVALLLQGLLQGLKIVIIRLQPGRELCQRGRQFALKQQMGHDRLQPSGSALVRTGDDDVVVAGGQPIPALAIEVVIADAARKLRVTASRVWALRVRAHQTAIVEKLLRT